MRKLTRMERLEELEAIRHDVERYRPTRETFP